jgi:hypothetical protein
MMIDAGGGREGCRGKFQPCIIARNAPAANCQPRPSRRHPLFSSRARPLHMRTRRRRAAEMVKMEVDTGRWP